MRYVLSGLQSTPYPITHSEQETVYKEYMHLIHGEHKQIKKPHRNDFIGPQSIALQQKHLYKTNDVNILKNYMVTEKADGERTLLYVSNSGKIYMINQNMKVIFTGTETKEKSCLNSILDGEFLLTGKHGQLLFMFAAFDIYYIGSRKEPHIRNLASVSYTHLTLPTSDLV